MFKANKNYLNLQGSYLFSTIAKKVAAYQEAHPDADIIRLGIGDVTQPLVPEIIKTLHEGVDEMAHKETFHGYSPDLGYEFLRSAIAEEYRQRGCQVSDNEIFVSDGAKSDSGNIQEIFSEDSRVAVCDPVYPVYVDSNVMAGRSGAYDQAAGRYKIFIYMPCTEANNFTPEFPKENPDIIYLCYPNNPTGAVMEREDLEALAPVIEKHDLYVLSDEIYGELTYTGNPHVSIASIPGMQERTILINGFSKAYAMTGWRLGYVAGPERIVKQMTKIHQYCIMCAPTTSQYAAVDALRNGDEDVKRMRESYDERRRYVLHALHEMGIPCFEPEGAFYVFPCIRQFGMTSEEFSVRLLQEEKVAIVPGTAFGDCGEGYLRISYAYSIDDLKKALGRLRKFVQRLQAENAGNTAEEY